MKKTLIFIFLVFVLLATTSAQSMLSNSYYIRSLELQAEAEAAFDEGDYDLAADLAMQAEENSRLSDEYVAKMILMHDATEKIAEAQTKYDWAITVRAETRFPEQFALANTDLAMAKENFKDEAYNEAIFYANTVLQTLSAVTFEGFFPKYFVVRELSQKHDCFWRIAGLPFVYNDPFKWPLLYNANKSKLPNPGNPDLILPGMTLIIPEAGDEIREGTWVDGNKYPVYKSK